VPANHVVRDEFEVFDETCIFVLSRELDVDEKLGPNSSTDEVFLWF